MNRESEVFRGGGRLVALGLVSFVVGLVGLLFGAATNGRAALFAYLSSYAWALSLALGALIFLMTVHTMDAKWPVAIRRILEAMTGVLPLLAVGVVPILLTVPRIYSWAAPETITGEEARHVVAHAAPWLGYQSFVVRAIIYFAVWLGFSFFLRRFSLRSDTRPEAAHKVRARVVSALGLPFVSLALTFASFDWLMSLEPTWYSTMYGVYFFAGGFVAAFSLVVLLTAGAQRAGFLPRVTRSHYYALGRLMLAFVIFWAYAGYFQFFLIWIANKPREVTFYAARMHGAWGITSLVLVATHFVLPFFALLSYRIKQSAATLSPIAVLLVAAHWLDMEWLVMPALRPNGPAIAWVDIAALLCVGGACLAFGVWRQRGLALVPKHDPSLEAAFRYESV